MNGRLYDPVLGRMLSPDPYIQLPGFAQNYNRYSYVWNNPLKFTDPNGEWIIAVLSTLANMYWNGLTSNGFQFNPAKWDWSSSSTYGNLALGAYNGYQIGASLEGSYKNVSGAQTGSSKPVWSEEFQSYLVPETVADFKYVSQGFIRQGGTNENLASRLKIDWKSTGLSVATLAGFGSGEYAGFRELKNAEIISHNKDLLSFKVTDWEGAAAPVLQSIDPKFLKFAKVANRVSFSADVITTASSLNDIYNGSTNPRTHLDATAGSLGLLSTFAEYYYGIEVPYVGEAVAVYGTVMAAYDLGAQFGPLTLYNNSKIKKRQYSPTLEYLRRNNF